MGLAIASLDPASAAASRLSPATGQAASPAEICVAALGVKHGMSVGSLRANIDQMECSESMSQDASDASLGVTIPVEGIPFGLDAGGGASGKRAQSECRQENGARSESQAREFFETALSPAHLDAFNDCIRTVTSHGEPLMVMPEQKPNGETELQIWGDRGALPPNEGEIRLQSVTGESGLDCRAIPGKQVLTRQQSTLVRCHWSTDSKETAGTISVKALTGGGTLYERIVDVGRDPDWKARVKVKGYRIETSRRKLGLKCGSSPTTANRHGARADQRIEIKIPAPTEKNQFIEGVNLWPPAERVGTERVFCSDGGTGSCAWNGVPGTDSGKCSSKMSPEGDALMTCENIGSHPITVSACVPLIERTERRVRDVSVAPDRVVEKALPGEVLHVAARPGYAYELEVEYVSGLSGREVTRRHNLSEASTRSFVHVQPAHDLASGDLLHQIRIKAPSL